MSAATLTVRVAASGRKHATSAASNSSAMTARRCRASTPAPISTCICRAASCASIRCNHPEHGDRYQIAVLRDADGRGGSRTIHDAVRQGDTVRIGVPRNQASARPDAPHHLLLAGGIGVTPILSMAERLFSSGGAFDMHYCARSTDRMAFVERINAAGFRDRARFHVDDGAPEQRFDLAAVLAGARRHAPVRMRAARLHGCGVERRARALGGSATALRVLRRRGGGVRRGSRVPGPDRAAARVIDVPAECTVIAALAANGVDVLTSCEQGVCGTCLTRVLQGGDHRDAYLTDEEKAAGDQFMPCCSRARTDLLVLDL